MSESKSSRTVVIDADGCPVTRLACRLAKEYNTNCRVVCDSAHMFSGSELYGAEVRVVSQGSDSADFYIVNHIVSGDIVITQDYGLAAMCLAKNVSVLDQNGRVYNNENISWLLESRAANKKLIRSGKYPKGAPKRKQTQNESFERALRGLLEEKEKKDEQI